MKRNILQSLILVFAIHCNSFCQTFQDHAGNISQDAILLLESVVSNSFNGQPYDYYFYYNAQNQLIKKSKHNTDGYDYITYYNGQNQLLKNYKYSKKYQYSKQEYNLFTYSNGLLSTISTFLSHPDWQRDTVFARYFYDSGNRLIKELHHINRTSSNDLELGGYYTYDYTIEYFYDSLNRKVSESHLTDYDKKIYEFTYNNQNELISTFIKFYILETNEILSCEKDSLIKNRSGLDSVILKGYNGKFDTRRIFKYDRFNNVISISNESYTHVGNGNYSFIIDTLEEYQFDSLSRMISKKIPYSGDLFQQTQFEYDSKNRLISTIVFDPRINKPGITYEYAYDEIGNLISSKRTIFSYLEGEDVLKNITMYKDTVLYDTSVYLKSELYNVSVHKTMDTVLYSVNKPLSVIGFQWQNNEWKWKFNSDYNYKTNLITSTNVERMVDKLSFYPNPAQDRIYFSGIDRIKYKIVDFTGREMFSGFAAKEQGIQIESLATGIYFIKLTDSDSSQLYKFIKL